MNRVLFKIHQIEQQRLYFRHHTKFKEHFQSSLINTQPCHDYARFGTIQARSEKFTHNFRHSLGTGQARLKHNFGTTQARFTHTSCTNCSCQGMLYKLTLEQPHALKNFCVKKTLSYLVTLVIAQMWAFPIFKNYRRKKAEHVSVSKISFLSSLLQQELKQKRSFKSLFSWHVDGYNTTTLL